MHSIKFPGKVTNKNDINMEHLILYYHHYGSHSMAGVVTVAAFWMLTPHWFLGRDKVVPVTTAWRVPRLWIEKRPPDMEGRCQYTE
jgi:hypothetical protein